MKEEDFQKEILKTLDEYSESLIATSTLKHKKKARECQLVKDKSHQIDGRVTSSRRKKKKLKQKQKSATADSNEKHINEMRVQKKKIKSKKNQLQMLKKEIEQTNVAKGKEGKTCDVPMKRPEESMLKGNEKRKAEPEVIVFQSRKRKLDDSENKGKTTVLMKHDDSSRPEFDMKMARYEVQRYGIKGFQGAKKEEAMTSLMMKLGAKPPKNKYLNYKEYMEQVKRDQVENRDKRELDRKLGYKMQSSNKRDRKKTKDKNDIGELDGQVGKFKSGVLFVKKTDLVNSSKSKL
ncbi:hypothetical protein FSP39_005345 [Pinctada imbricata]|uniref:Uncharacterized protein n=1 Tax=Pinctada imbricata TaxID=66713 RepID=A0AA88Y392_PINIB|nr:hypothetical protein FSP39_005345 [Pinctada imbricata]